MDDSGHVELFRRAHRLTHGLVVHRTHFGVELLWKRRYTDYLASVCRVERRTLAEALQFIIDVEEDRKLRLEHGEHCPCEDCCNARIDRSRRGR